MKVLNRIIILCVTTLLVSALVGCMAKIQSKPGVTTTIILTRHADRTIFSMKLTEKGRKRAKDLVKAVGNLKINAIYSPDLERNLDTARPLAEHLGIDITVVNSNPDELVKTFLTKHAGEVVLWVGNTTNLGDIYYKLGGQDEAPDNYGDLCIMKISDKGAPEVFKTRYGGL